MCFLGGTEVWRCEDCNRPLGDPYAKGDARLAVMGRSDTLGPMPPGWYWALCRGCKQARVRAYAARLREQVRNS